MNISFSDINTWLYGIATGLLASVIWLLRKVNTNEKKIEILQGEINIRAENRKDLDESIKSELREMRDDIKSLMRRP